MIQSIGARQHPNGTRYRQQKEEIKRRWLTYENEKAENQGIHKYLNVNLSDFTYEFLIYLVQL
jgi:hypothetical protein